MALTVWKFPLKLDALQDVEMPVGSRVLHVAYQHGVLCLWAWCNPHPAVPEQVWRITISGTGHFTPAKSEAEHIGTVLSHDEDFVWHIFGRPL